jgi:TolB-like protein
MTRRIPAPAAAIAVALMLLGCQPPKAELDNSPAREPILGLVDINYAAADSLLGNLRIDLSPARPILVATIVDIDNLERSSTLGRLIAEQAGSRLSQRGYHVKEIKLRNSVVFRERGGEFMLSRDYRTLSARYDAQAVLTGTYAVGKEEIYVNLRMVLASDSRLISSFDYVLRTTRNVASLIGERLLGD